MSFSLFFGDGTASTLDGRYFCGPTSEARQVSALLQVKGPVLLMRGGSKMRPFVNGFRFRAIPNMRPCSPSPRRALRMRKRKRGLNVATLFCLNPDLLTFKCLIVLNLPRLAWLPLPAISLLGLKRARKFSGRPRLSIPKEDRSPRAYQ